MDYYEILEVTKSATEDEIKKAYRKLAKKCHPDVDPKNRDAEDVFKRLKEAYEILSDKEKRKTYDSVQKKSNPLESNFDQSKHRKSQSQQNRNENTYRKDPFDESKRETDRKMKEREQQLNDAEASLKYQETQFRASKQRHWFVIAVTITIICLAVGFGLIKFETTTNVAEQDLNLNLKGKVDSLNVELQIRDFIIDEGLGKSQLQKVRSFLIIYQLNRIAAHTDNSLDLFKREMRDRQKAEELYQRLRKDKVNLNMNFEQFYRTVYFE